MDSLEISLNQIQNEMKMVKNELKNVKIEIEKTDSTSIRIDNYKQILAKAKVEFEAKYNENSTAASSKGLSDFTFTAIVGQGAFGVVVCNKNYHLSIIYEKLSSFRNW